MVRGGGYRFRSAHCRWQYLCRPYHRGIVFAVRTTGGSTFAGHVGEVHEWLERAKETLKGDPDEITKDLRTPLLTHSYKTLDVFKAYW